MSEFIISGFSDEIDSRLDVQLEVVKSLGIDYIEMRGVNGRNVSDYSVAEIKLIKDQLDEAGIGVSAIGSPIGKIKITDPFEPHFDLFKNTVELAKVLKTKYIRIFSFFMDATEVDQYRGEVMKRMKAFCDYVEGSDIVLLHENEKDIYGDTPIRCLDIYETINSTNLALIFDPANFVQCGVVTYPYAFDMLDEYVVYYHIKDALKRSGEVVPSGYGDGCLPQIISRLHERGYKGFLSLEPHLGHFDGFDALEGDGDIPVFEEVSDSSKFILAAECLQKVISEVTNGKS